MTHKVEFSAGQGRSINEGVNYMLCRVDIGELEPIELYAEIDPDEVLKEDEDWDHNDDQYFLDKDFNGTVVSAEEVDERCVAILTKEIIRQAKEAGIEPHTLDFGDFDLRPYTVYWVGGERDGEKLGRFDTAGDAINFAAKFYKDHEKEFDPVCGGIGIDDENGNPIEW